MTACRPEIVSPWLVDGSVVTIRGGNTTPPRDPEDDEDDEDDDLEDEDEDERQDEPAVIREPDE